MNIIVYGKDNCPICEKFKTMLSNKKLAYKYDNAEKYTEYHTGWREDGSVELKAFSEFNEGVLPIIRIDDKLYNADEANNVLGGVA